MLLSFFLFDSKNFVETANVSRATIGIVGYTFFLAGKIFLLSQSRLVSVSFLDWDYDFDDEGSRQRIDNWANSRDRSLHNVTLRGYLNFNLLTLRNR